MTCLGLFPHSVDDGNLNPKAAGATGLNTGEMLRTVPGTW